MPCDSSYLAPNSRESGLQTAAQLLEYVYKCVCRPVPTKLKAAAKNIYCTDDYVGELCYVLSHLSSAQKDQYMYNGRLAMARRLADWWEEHQRADRERIKQEQRERDEEIAEAKAILKKHGVL